MLYRTAGESANCRILVREAGEEIAGGSDKSEEADAAAAL
jgi:hypothetical protein